MQTQSAPVVTAPPRHWLIESLLFIFTCGLYASIWCYLTARDLRRITGRALSPTWWLAVPIFVVTIPFAMLYFFTILREAEQKAEVKSWPKVLDYLWVLILFGSALSLAVLPDTAMELGSSVLVFLLWTGMWLLLHSRVNRLRRQFANKPVFARQTGMNILEWCTLSLTIPGTLFLLSYYALWGMDTINEEIVPGTKINKPELHFSVEITQSGWQEVVLGTVSDGSAEFELRGPGLLRWYSVFTYEKDNNVISLNENRLNDFVDGLDAPECNAKRSFVPDSLKLHAVILCESRQLDSNEMYISVMTEGEHNIVELVGYLYGNGADYDIDKVAFISDAKGLAVDE